MILTKMVTTESLDRLRASIFKIKGIGEYKVSTGMSVTVPSKTRHSRLFEFTNQPFTKDLGT